MKLSLEVPEALALALNGISERTGEPVESLVVGLISRALQVEHLARVRPRARKALAILSALKASPVSTRALKRSLGYDCLPRLCELAKRGLIERAGRSEDEKFAPVIWVLTPKGASVLESQSARA